MLFSAPASLKTSSKSNWVNVCDFTAGVTGKGSWHWSRVTSCDSHETLDSAQEDCGHLPGVHGELSMRGSLSCVNSIPEWLHVPFCSMHLLCVSPVRLIGTSPFYIFMSPIGNLMSGSPSSSLCALQSLCSLPRELHIGASHQGPSVPDSW